MARSKIPSRKSSASKNDPVELSKYIMTQLKKEGADDVVVSSSGKRSLMIKYSNSKVNTSKTIDLTHLNVFMSKDRRLVTTDVVEFSKASADLAVKQLMAFAKAVEPNEEYMGIADPKESGGKFKYASDSPFFDKKLADLGSDSINYVKDAIALSEDEGAKRSSGVLETTDYNAHILTSNGVEAEEKGTRIYFSIRSFTDKDASGHQVSVARSLKAFDWQTPVKRAAEIAKMAKNPVSAEGGKYDIIFDYLPYANILNTVGSSASVFSVEAGLSFLADQLGKKVGSEHITFMDDATMPEGFNSCVFDGEGVPTQKTVLIDKGVLKTYLHSTSTAKRHNTKTTANAGIISPNPFNLSLAKGDMTKDEMIANTKRGIYISNVWYTRFQNYRTGDFSTIPRDGAFLVENGKITKSLKDLRVSDNILNLMKNTSGLTKDTWQIFGWEVDIPTTTPMALVKGVNITRSEK